MKPRPLTDQANSTPGTENKPGRQEDVTWTAIQKSLEWAESDILILLDCCYSGVVNTSGGRGANELIAACDYNGIANGVGIFSYTHNLVIELQHLLATKGTFTTDTLWREMYSRMQSHKPLGVQNERYPPPVHHKLAQPRGRSIELSPLPPPGLQPKKKRQCPDSGGDFLLAFRLKDSVSLRDLDKEALGDWIGSIPAPVEGVNISIPPAPRICVSDNPAIILPGPIESCGATNRPSALGMKTVEASISESQGDPSTPPEKDGNPGSLMRDVKEHFETLLEQVESDPPKEDNPEPDSRDLDDDTMNLVSQIKELAHMLGQEVSITRIDVTLERRKPRVKEVSTEETPGRLPFRKKTAAKEARDLRWDRYFWTCVSIRREI